MNVLNTEYKLERLKKLYRDIHACSMCASIRTSGMGDDIQKVARIVNRKALDSQIFAIGQALGETTQRLSGIPYTYTDGCLSRSGRNLDKFLNLFGYTVDYNHIGELQYAYCSDIVQCYPGKQRLGHGDKKPEPDVIHLCLGQQYLFQEIKLVEPKLILLMGQSARDNVYKYMLKKAYPESLTEHISQILESSQMDFLDLNGIHSYVMPIQHPSGVNPRFIEMIRNDALNSLVRKVLK